MPNLVHNDQVKLLANSLDRASTSCLVLGVLGPLWGAYSNQLAMGIVEFAVGTVSWFAAAFGLHLMSQRIMRRLIE